MCPAVVVTTSTGSNCVVTFILEYPVYVHLKPSNNDILLSDGYSSDIKLLTKSGEIKPFFSVSSSLRPLGE
jgi:hypothetical protein